MSKHGLHRLNKEITQIIFICSIFFFLFYLSGCQTLARKFTRKPKGEPKKEEPVIQPEVYPDVAQGKDELYKDYFTFWESWADELIEFLNEKANSKKQKECAALALDNLIKMRELLKEEKAKSLEPKVIEFAAVKAIVFAGRLISSDYYYLKNKVERIKSMVHRNFAYSRIKQDLKNFNH